MKLCDYGCEQEAKFQLENNRWCCSEYFQSCPEIRRKTGLPKRGRKLGPQTDEHKKNLSESKKGKKPKKYPDSHRSKQKQRMLNSGSVYANSFPRDPEKIKKQYENLKVLAQKQWEDPEYQRKQRETRNLKPNVPETKILNLLSKLYPNEWKYTGDWSFWVNEKNPDFTCTNDKKFLIEHFGDRYHGEEFRRKFYNDFSSNKEHEEELKKKYEEFGYKTLVIWENELKDMKEVERKIKEFIKIDQPIFG